MTKVYIHVSTTFCREDLLHSLWQRQSSRAAFCCVLIHVSRSRMKGCWAHLPWDHVSTWSHGEEREKGWKEGKGRWRGRRREGEEGIARERDLGAEGPRGRGFPFLREKEASPPRTSSLRLMKGRRGREAREAASHGRRWWCWFPELALSGGGRRRGCLGRGRRSCPMPRLRWVRKGMRNVTENVLRKGNVMKYIK